MVKGMIFDLDGVVTDTAELHYRAWKALADKYGYTFDREINERLRGVSRVASLQIILNGSHVDSQDFERMLAEKNSHYLGLLATLSDKDILPGVSSFLEDLKAQGHKLAIGSSSKNASLIIDRLRLNAVFEKIADGNSVERSKPEPDVFIHAAGQIGLNCRDCIVFEDSIAGIEAAKQAGMQTVAIGEPLAASEPDLLLATTEGLSYSAIQCLI